MPIDPSISLNAQVPNAMTTIGNMLNIGNQQVALQRAQQTLPYDVQAAQANAQGATANANVATQTQQPRISQAQAQSTGATAVANTEQLANMRAHLSNAAQMATNLLQDPNLTRAKIASSLAETLTNAGAPPNAIAQALAGMPPTDAPAQLKAFVTQGLLRTQEAAKQLDSMYPAPALATTGGAVMPLAQGNPALTGVAPGTLQGPATPLTLGPDQRQTVSINPITQSPMVTSKDEAGNVTQITPGPTTPGVPNLSPGQPQAIVANTATAADDWKQTFSASQKASQNIGVLQNLKMLAPQAILGLGSEYRSYVAGVAGLFDQDEKTQNMFQSIVGAKSAQEAKTATDLFLKNANMPSLAGGTDAMRNLLESTNPNVHMTPVAVAHAADQVIAQQEIPLLRSKYLQSSINDPQTYMQKANTFNQMADPRALQYPSLSLVEQKKMYTSMNPQERRAFQAKLQFFQDNGWLQ